MSSFYAYDFVFDDVPSLAYDLKIISLDEDGIFSGVGSSNVEILSQRVLRKAKPYYLGRIQNQVLEFPLTFGTSQIISGMERDLISAWLFGRSGYKKLQILQDDLNGAYFNCFMNNPEPVYIGNLNYAFRCTVVCDSPFAYLPEKIYTSGSFIASETVYKTINIYNQSSDDDYTYPIVKFKPHTTTPTVFSITNHTDDDREFSFSSIPFSEEIYVDNDLQIVRTNETAPYQSAMAYFNAGWLRLKPRMNTLYVTTNAQSLEIRHTERVKIGG